MTPPIRAQVHVLVDFPWDDPGQATLREGIEWFKQFVRGCEPLGMLTALEQKTADERWALLCGAIAETQGVPSGMLSYFMGEVAQAEMNLARTAEQELAAAQMYGSK